MPHLRIYRGLDARSETLSVPSSVHTVGGLRKWLARTDYFLRDLSSEFPDFSRSNEPRFLAAKARRARELKLRLESRSLSGPPSKLICVLSGTEGGSRLRGERNASDADTLRFLSQNLEVTPD